jgi:hypothetical protein
MTNEFMGTYERSKPCGKCGGTLYYLRNYSCVACQRARQTKKPAVEGTPPPPLFREEFNPLMAAFLRSAPGTLRRE